MQLRVICCSFGAASSGLHSEKTATGYNQCTCLTSSNGGRKNGKSFIAVAARDSLGNEYTCGRAVIYAGQMRHDDADYDDQGRVTCDHDDKRTKLLLEKLLMIFTISTNYNHDNNTHI